MILASDIVDIISNFAVTLLGSPCHPVLAKGVIFTLDNHPLAETEYAKLVKLGSVEGGTKPKAISGIFFSLL